MWRIVIASAWLLLVYGAPGSVQIIDSEPKSIESIASSLCQDGVLHTKRIGRQSTIGQLSDFFASLPDHSELAACGGHYLKPLQQLKTILETSSENVCSREKMEQINKFHWNYIVASLSRKWHKVSHERLPEPLRVFFMNYANEIAEKCKETLADRLKAAVGDNGLQSEALFSKELGSSIDELNLVLIPQKRVTNYNSFFFLWNQIIAKERRKGIELIDAIDRLTGEPIVALIKVKHPQNAWELQHKCRHELRPIYKDTVLPVMRLLEMGYGEVDEQSRATVRNDKSIGNWYAMAQLCELFVPINFYQDESLKPGEATILSDENEAEGLGRPTDLVSIDKISSSNIYIKAIRLEDLLLSAANNEIVKQVKTNLKARSHLFRQFIRNVMSSLKGKFTSKLKNFILSRHTKDNKYSKENGVDIIKKSETEFNEFLEDNEDDETRSLRRTRRSDMDEEPKKKKTKLQKVTHTFMAVLKVLGWIILILFLIMSFLIIVCG